MGTTAALSSEAMWECTTCGACVEACPVSIEQMPKIVDTRRYLVMEQAEFPDTMFYFLPNILLSGFMFPFEGMPRWARWIGEVLPLTHFNRLMRGIMLKGNGWPDLWTDVWPIALFIVLVMFVALRFYRRTLD